MPKIPIMWTFKRNSNLHTVQVTDTCDVRGAETILLGHAVTWIEHAMHYLFAIPLTEVENSHSPATVTVDFKLVFRNEKDISDFFEYISNQYEK